MAQDFDGSKIKSLVENESRFKEYVDREFAALDADHKGTLTQKELSPLMVSLGEALGLPPPGSSTESDHLYDEVFSEFSNGKPVTKQTFAKELRNVLLGLADGLERDPISIIVMDGKALREYAKSGTFEPETAATFSLLDTAVENKLKAIALVDALKSISISKGMPPVMDPKMKIRLRDALVASKVDTEDYLDQFQFAEALKVVLLSMADSMAKSPINVAYSEKTYNGETIKSLLKDEKTLHTVLDEAWNRLSKDKHGKIPKSSLPVGLDEMSVAAGLPPLGVVDEIDDDVKTVFNKMDVDERGTYGKEEFDKRLLEVLGSLMIQLGGKPVTIKSSSIIEEEHVDAIANV